MNQFNLSMKKLHENAYLIIYSVEFWVYPIDSGLMNMAYLSIVKASRPLFSVMVISDNHCGLTFLFDL
jgi:hypothetical protein